VGREKARRNEITEKRKIPNPKKEEVGDAALGQVEEERKTTPGEGGRDGLKEVN